MYVIIQNDGVIIQKRLVMLVRCLSQSHNYPGYVTTTVIIRTIITLYNNSQVTAEQQSVGVYHKYNRNLPSYNTVCIFESTFKTALVYNAPLHGT